MNSILQTRWNRAALAVAVVVSTTLAGCASAPTATSAAHSAPSAQPLQRLDIVPDPAETALVSDLLGGELALAESDADTAAQRYLAAAQVSTDPQVAEQAVRIALAGRRWALAQTALSRWQALHGDEVGVRQAHAMLALHGGDAEAAMADLTWLLQRPRGEGWRAVSQVLISADNRAQSGQMLAQLLHFDRAQGSAAFNPTALGDDAHLWIAVGQVAQQLERGDIADAIAQRAVARFHSPETYAWAAQVRLAQGDRDGALKLFADALHNGQAVPGKGGREAESRLRVAYAAMLGDAGDNARAAAVLAQGPQDDRVFAARAAYLARGDTQANKAQIDLLYRQVLAEAEPRPSLRLLLLGQLSEIDGRKTDALRWYAQLSEDDDEWLDAQQRTAVVLDDLGRSAEAMNLLHQLEAHMADENAALGEVFLLEAELAGAKGQREADSIAVYDRALAVLPDDTRLIYARALAYADVNRNDDSERDLRRVLALKPNDADALNALGYTLADHSERGSKGIDEALALIEKALKLKPGEPAIIDSMGWVQYRLGNLDVATQQLRAAYAKQPDPEIAAHLGEVLWVSGKKAEARQVWDEGRKKDGDNKVLRDTIKRLTS